MIEIVLEEHQHHAAIRELTVAAFANSELGHDGEADLIELIREQSEDCLSLIAVDGFRVVGHILFSPATIRTPKDTFHGMGLAPISVLPSEQHKGIGSRLISEGLNRLKTLECNFVIVAGHPDFYPRFGFRSAAEQRIRHGFEGMPQEIFFLLRTQDGIADRVRGGKAFYHKAFGSQHSDSMSSSPPE